jgi:hypothetical protein
MAMTRQNANVAGNDVYSHRFKIINFPFSPDMPSTSRPLSSPEADQHPAELRHNDPTASV